jgi:hypothetical protein
LERVSLQRIHFNVARDLTSTVKRLTPAAAAPRDVNAEIAPTDVRSALDRVRKSRTLGGSGRLIEFLTFVVEASLNGEYLKETTIGVSVFGCRTDYDPKADAIVRSQAWRLRSKLKDYYENEGAEDPLVIDLPKGHYVPVFSVRNTSEAEKSSSFAPRRQHLRQA